MSVEGRPIRPKANPSTLVFKRLTADCGRGAFNCGETEIDDWFRQEALIDHQAMRLRTVTAHFGNDPGVIGFYALTDHLESESKLRQVTGFTALFRRGGYFPTVRLAWLAVRSEVQKQGFGTIIMGAVVRDFYEIVIRTGISALTLTAINGKVASFYEGLGFVPYGDPKAVRPDMLLPYQSAVTLIENEINA